jgi:hypothetical protein
LSFAARALQLLQDTLTQSDGITLAALRMLDDLPCNHLRKRVSPPLQAQSSEDVFIRCRESLHSVRVERSLGEHAVNRHRALLPRPEHSDFNSFEPHLSKPGRGVIHNHNALPQHRVANVYNTSSGWALDVSAFRCE